MIFSVKNLSCFVAGTNGVGETCTPVLGSGDQADSYYLTTPQVGREGFEPPTHWSGTNCSDQAELPPLRGIEMYLETVLAPRPSKGCLRHT